MIVITNVINVSASPVSEEKNKKKSTEQKLDKVNDEIENIEEEKADMEEEAEGYEQELVDLLVTIQVINGDIESKEFEIGLAQKDYDAALKQQEEQKQAMNKRIKYMYEKGNLSYMQILLESKNFSDAINKPMYSEKLYAYDRYQLYIYEQTKQLVLDKKTELTQDLEELEEIKADATEQEMQLEALIDEYSEKIENFDAQLDSAKEKAASYKEQIQKQTESIKQMEEEERKKAEEEKRKKAEEEAKRKAEEEAKRKAEEERKKSEEEAEEENSGESESSENQDESSSENSDDNGSEGSSEAPQPQSSGSGLGQDIANYACQFIGNPYVAGGTSLTEGADCSGFTQAVYQAFGISLPRTSGSQAGYGREVSYAEAAPGDIIYYGGHVGIYIGNGLIVHASTQSTGIKISNALYRSIITVRRIV